ncbi:MAG: gliding motility-associated C-terminal domain-containing protein, partial [Salinivirgaceae bacterium]|nr:gliding motility-associated C-terminal domain-containing protein [Salinivirgaceae bacterium]
STVQPPCYGDTDGSVTVEITGGNEPYFFTATNQETSEEISDVGSTIANLAAGSYRLRIRDGNNCVTAFKALDLQSEVPHMTVGIEIDNRPTCNVNSIDGQLSATVIAGEHPHIPLVPQPDPSVYSYSWSNDSVGQSVSGFGLGSHAVTVTYEGLCPVSNFIYIDSAHHNIFANATLDPTAGITKDSTFCIGDMVRLFSNYAVYGLDGVYVNADSVVWTSENAIEYRPITDTVEYYTVARQNSAENIINVTVYSNGCSNVDSLHVRAFDIPEVAVAAFKQDFTLGGFIGNEPLSSIFVDNKAIVRVDEKVTDSTSYTWSETLYTTVQGLEQTNSIVETSEDGRAIIVRPIDSTFYKVTASTKAYPTREHYCISTDSALVRVLGEFNPPNAFSPNGDGSNDTWKLEGFTQFASVNVIIFNRWGQKVFESTDPQGQWDGTNKKGKDLPVGTYYYVIEYKTDTGSKKTSGPVTIIR